MSKQLVSEQMDDASGGVAASASQQAADKRVMSLLAELEALALEASPATLLQAAERLRLAGTPQGSAASRPATNHNLASDSPVQPRMLPFTAQAGCDDELDDDRRSLPRSAGSRAGSSPASSADEAEAASDDGLAGRMRQSRRRRRPTRTRR